METSSSPNHAGKNSEENDLDGEEPSWEEHHVPEEVDMMERCLKLEQKWPQILELLCQEETSLKDVRIGYYTNIECLCVQWCEYVHELKDGMFYTTRQS